MVKSTKQNWNVGQVVKVGFVNNLTVIETRSIVDHLPDMYLLRRDTGVWYRFIPHNGIEKLGYSPTKPDQWWE
jgi:hypothetical protein